MTSALATRNAQLAENAARGLSPLLVAAERLAATVILGVHGRKRAGPGENFWQYRPYGFGDSTQRIDWRRSARSDRIFIRENEWEAANTLWLWANTGPRMDFKSTRVGTTKKERALLLSLALGSLALRAHERVGELASAEPAGHGRTTLLRVARSMSSHQSAALPRRRALQRGATAVLISDFLDDPADITEAMLQIAASNVRGHLVQVNDPAEETLPYDGRIEFEGLDTQQKFLANRTQNLRDAYIEKFQLQRAAVRTLAARLGWSFTVHRTDQSPTACLLALHQHISDGYRPNGIG